MSWSKVDLDLSCAQLETIDEGPVSIVSRTSIVLDDGKARWIAVKTSSVHKNWSKEPHDIAKELRLLSSLNHTNIIAVLGHSVDTRLRSLSFWMPFAPVSLVDLLSSTNFSPHPLISLNSTGSTLTPRELRFIVLAKSIIFQILSAVAYLHDTSQCIAHRDIKPNNILLTETACVKLIDFGIAWKESEDVHAKKDDVWPEHVNKMYFEVATGPYRAPELLFGPQTYDAFALDLWSLGVTFAEFFTALRLSRSDDDQDEMDFVGARNVSEEVEPFIIPQSIRIGDPAARWCRNTLFNSHRGEIGLAWSIFSIRGTPNPSIWPTFLDLPDAPKVKFFDVPSIEMSLLLPNLPPSTTHHNVSTANHTPSPTMVPVPLDLLHRLLVYTPSERIHAAAALRHPWFIAEPPLIVPLDYPSDATTIHDFTHTTIWQDQNLGELLQANLPSRQF